MTEAPAISGHGEAAAIGPGRLVLVVGPSGAGKDTLIGLARAACADDGKAVFPRRVVTREASSFEDNEQLGLDAFWRAQAQGEFAVHWEAHGHCYALRRAIDDDIRAGRTVVANVSRTVVEAMRRRYADVVVVRSPLRQKFSARGLPDARGSDGRVADRLGRAVDSAAVDFTIVNVGDAETHAGELLQAIRGS